MSKENKLIPPNVWMYWREDQQTWDVYNDNVLVASYPQSQQLEACKTFDALYKRLWKEFQHKFITAFYDALYIAAVAAEEREKAVAHERGARHRAGDSERGGA